MKNMFKKLTALLTAGAALCSMLPLGTAAYSYRVYTRGTFAVVVAVQGEGDEVCYLLRDLDGKKCPES